ncbi:btaf1 RNA polymerase II, B-TFIID transcription factor-associated, 170kDa [Cladochytrium tenue]|nr:btaf1 RNA polymerase II, B-TFIID transcription factor-associated, 170kDa [Cladochytrium tenue]
MRLSAKAKGHSASEKIVATSLSSSSTSRKRSTVTEESSDPKKIKLEAKPNAEESVVVEHKPREAAALALGVVTSGDEWPFEGLCEQLALDLFHPNWERRHGAALGLREILKTHVNGAGRLADLDVAVNETRHRNWLEDISIRLLCVLALDRFADFVGDHAVAPVRETCAQTLGVVVKSCDKPTCLRIVHQGLLKLIQGGEGAKRQDQTSARESRWEVRHAGLIGLKYWMAVRKDLVQDVLLPDSVSGKDSGVFLSILNGLKDKDDDVCSVASGTLLPISDVLVGLLSAPKVYTSIVKTLWDCLLDLDDLSAATSFVMDLLSQLLMNKQIEGLVMSESAELLGANIRRMYPFFRHTLTSVRTSVLKTMCTLADLSVDKPAYYSIWVTSDLLALVFQNFILEEKGALVELSSAAWQKFNRLWCLGLVPGADEVLLGLVKPFFSLIMTPVGTPINQSLLRTFAAKSNGNAKAKQQSLSTQDLAWVNQELTVVAEADVVRGRVAGAAALGRLLHNLLVQDIKLLDLVLQQVVLGYVSSGWANHRMVASIVIKELAVAYFVGNTSLPPLVQVSPSLQSVWTHLVNDLSAADRGGSFLYHELLFSLGRLRTECQSLVSFIAELKWSESLKLPPLPSETGSTTSEDSSANPFGPVFTKDVANKLIQEALPQLVQQVKAVPNYKWDQGVESRLTALSTRIQSALDGYAVEQNRWDIVALATAASAVVCMGQLPPKVNPIVKPLMNGVKNEEFELIQSLNANALAALIHLNSGRPKMAAVTDRIIRNLTIFLCEESEWGSIATNAGEFGVLSMMLTDKQDPSDPNHAAPGEKPRQRRGGGGPGGQNLSSADVQLAAEIGVPDDADAAKKKSLTARRGAQFALQEIAKKFGESLFAKVPKLWELVLQGIKVFSSEDGNDPTQAIEKCSGDPLAAQIAMDSLNIASTLCPVLSSALHSQMLGLLASVAYMLCVPVTLLRHTAAQFFAAMTKTCTVKTFETLIHHILPMLGDAASVTKRRGAVETVFLIVNSLEDDKLLPYIVFLVVPVLSRMSDPDDAIRFLSTSVFAQLVKLLPLEAGVADPEGLDSGLRAKKVEERKFMGQLIGAEKIDGFELPQGIDAELRPYQKDGVNWLAFLNRYGLHGILCDDMGLGKTLQSICILAADHHQIKNKQEGTTAMGAGHSPSLVVCPPTLTGHWLHEIRQYAGSVLKAMLYTGSPSERMRHKRNIMNFDVVVISYDILRNDVEALNTFNWNYCILDEGHIIKNGKTKLTKAVKSIRCMKRLILSGTPVQNNVLELWSLFDFLMPGFLGTEQQFNARFGKPILASKDAKGSSKEQEAGALALEALHKQVLPFLLRRMKEDVLDDLPPKIIQDYYVELSDLQKCLYEDFGKSKEVAGVTQELAAVASSSSSASTAAAGAAADKPAKSAHAFQALQYLKKLCNHPALVLKPDNPHYAEIMKSIAAEGGSLSDIKHSPKIMALRQLLHDCGIGLSEDGTTVVETTAAHRALIFCQTREMLDYIETGLFKALMPTVTFLRMDGATEAGSRHDLVRQFNADPSIDVFLLTTSVGGLGLNLTGADTVIFVEHDWNPMKDLQAMDRAHRIGQKRVVNVYRLITRGTLEQKIMGLQKFKLNIAASVINQDNSGLGTMDTDQILNLFSFGGGDEAGGGEKASAGAAGEKLSAREVLEGLGKLWDEDQYESFGNVGDFVRSIEG